jgi:serine/threonine-protein phosphatase 2A regulatory subunit A
MANELGGFIPYVRGVEHAHVLLPPPLETLCIVEEMVVREKAVESLCSIGAQMKESDVVDWFIPFVKVSIGVSMLFPFFLLCLFVSLF